MTWYEKIYGKPAPVFGEQQKEPDVKAIMMTRAYNSKYKRNKKIRLGTFDPAKAKKLIKHFS